jgi:hypothetical protein
LLIMIDCERCLFELVRLRSLALKWFCPGFLAMSLPLRVIFKRFVYDLVVFTDMLFFLYINC